MPTLVQITETEDNDAIDRFFADRWDRTVRVQAHGTVYEAAIKRGGLASPKAPSFDGLTLLVLADPTL